jgi:hypothetical protein
MRQRAWKFEPIGPSDHLPGAGDALGKPEVRRSQKSGLVVVVLSCLHDAEAIVVRISSAGAGKPAHILIRRGIKGAPLKLEPSGALPRRSTPKPKRPGATPVSAG